MKFSKERIKAKVEKTDTGFSAYAKDYPVFTTGKTITELSNNIVEAMNLYYEEKKIEITANNINFEMDLQQFFQYYRVINAKFLAERVGVNATLLSQYVQGRKKPSELQTQKIMKGIQEIGRELSEISLM